MLGNGKCGKEEQSDAAKKNGVCIRCFKNATDEGRTVCAECMDKMGPKVLENNRRQFQKAKEEGNCTRCRKAPAVEGKTRCSECAAKAREEINAARALKREAKKK